MKPLFEGEPIMLREQIEVQATLLVVPSPEFAKPDFERARPATAADLEAVGYRHHDRARERAIELFKLMHLDYDDDDDDRICVLRYFIEMVTVYDHAPDNDSLMNLRNLITGKGEVEAT